MKKLILLTIFFLGVFFLEGFYLAALPEKKQQLVFANSPETLIINELMPNPIGADEAGEWIEIKNVGTTVINLQDWQIDGSNLPVITINPDEIAVLARNPQAVSANYPGVKVKIIQATFVLLNSADTVELTNKNNSAKNIFTYEESQEGKSFELLLGSCQIIAKHSASDTFGKENSLCSLYASPTVSPTPSPQITITPTLPAVIPTTAVRPPTQTGRISVSQQPVIDLPILQVPKIYRLKNKGLM